MWSQAANPHLVYFFSGLSIAAETSEECKHSLSAVFLKQLVKRGLCVWNLKGKEPHVLLNATEEVRKEVTVRESDTETLKTQAVFSAFKTLMGIIWHNAAGEIICIYLVNPHLFPSLDNVKEPIQDSSLWNRFLPWLVTVQVIHQFLKNMWH